jgi:hypothetical protein
MDAKAFSMFIVLIAAMVFGFEATQDSLTMQTLNAKADSLARLIDTIRIESARSEGNGSSVQSDYGLGWFVSAHIMYDLTTGYTFRVFNQNRVSVGIGVTNAPYTFQTVPDSTGTSYTISTFLPAAVVRIGFGSKVLHNIISIEGSLDHLVVLNHEINDINDIIDFGIRFDGDIAFWLTPQISLLLGAQSGIIDYAFGQGDSQDSEFSQVRFGFRTYPRFLNRHVTKGPRR